MGRGGRDAGQEEGIIGVDGRHLTTRRVRGRGKNKTRLAVSAEFTNAQVRGPGPAAGPLQNEHP